MLEPHADVFKPRDRGAPPGLHELAGPPLEPAAESLSGKGLAPDPEPAGPPSVHTQVKKVLVTDADGVLWAGALAEEEIQVSATHGAFQKQLKALKDHGVLLALCSKNEGAALYAALRDTPGMLLGPEDFTAIAADYQDKASNLRWIAERLNLSPASFVFVDDTPAELAAVARGLPQVNTLLFPSGAASPAEEAVSSFQAELAALFALQTDGAATLEGARRTQLYAEAAARERAGAALSLEEHLHALGLQAYFRIGQENRLVDRRLIELTERTSQFNLTGRRYPPEDWMAEEGALWDSRRYQIFSLQALDRFGDYGVVGVLILKRVEGEGRAVWEIDNFCLSCRALGRGLERCFMNEVAACCVNGKRAEVILGTHVPTARNGLMGEILPQLGFLPEGENRWRLAGLSLFDPENGPKANFSSGNPAE